MLYYKIKQKVDIMKLLKISFVLLIAVLLSLPVLADDKKAEDKPETPATVDANGIQWLSYDEGLAKAKKEGKHLFLDFTAKWCGYCKKMDKTTFIEPEIVALLNRDFVAVKVDGDSDKELDIDGFKITEKNLSRYEYIVSGFPTFWFLDSEGTKLGAVRGYQPADNLKNTLEYVKEKKYAQNQKSDENTEKDKKN
jgi:thioredoxin-related protein